MASSAPNPVVVTGAFERHNFGDLLLGRIMEVFLLADPDKGTGTIESVGL